MLRKLLCVLAAGLLVHAPARAEEAKKEGEKFEGTWKAVSAVRDGREAPQEDVEKMTLVVKGHDYTLKVGDQVIEGTHKLNPAKKPKTIDATRKAGPEKGQTILGIYELDGDTYKVCFAPPGKDRPTAFESKPGSGHRLIVMKRSKE